MSENRMSEKLLSEECEIRHNRLWWAIGFFLCVSFATAGYALGAARAEDVRLIEARLRTVESAQAETRAHLSRLPVIEKKLDDLMAKMK